MLRVSWSFSYLQRVSSRTSITLDISQELLLRHKDLFASLDFRHCCF